MNVFKLNDFESKTLLEITDDFIGKGEIPINYEMGKIEEVIDYVYANFRQGLEIEIIIKVKQNDE